MLREFIKNANKVDLDSHFPEFIQEALKAFDFGHVEMARLLKVSRPTVARWVNGEYAPHPLMRPATRDFLVKEAKKRL